MDIVEIVGFVFGAGLLISLVVLAWVIPAAVALWFWEWIKK